MALDTRNRNIRGRAGRGGAEGRGGGEERGEGHTDTPRGARPSSGTSCLPVPSAVWFGACTPARRVARGQSMVGASPRGWVGKQNGYHKHSHGGHSLCATLRQYDSLLSPRAKPPPPREFFSLLISCRTQTECAHTLDAIVTMPLPQTQGRLGGWRGGEGVGPLHGPLNLCLGLSQTRFFGFWAKNSTKMGVPGQKSSGGSLKKSENIADTLGKVDPFELLGIFS